MTGWVRLWHDMPTDPKWRAIARRSGRSVSEVIAVFNFVMVNGSANATERGRTHNLFADDIAAALDLQESEVQSVLDAMQGKVLDGDLITGWAVRQPKREDNSAERAKEWRARQKTERNQTQPNATERPDTDTESIERERRAREKIPESSQIISTPIDENFTPIDTPAVLKAKAEWPEGLFDEELDTFIAHAKANARIQSDWQAAFRTWIKKTNDRIRKNYGTGIPASRSVRTSERKSGFARALDDSIAGGTDYQRLSG